MGRPDELRDLAEPIGPPIDAQLRAVADEFEETIGALWDAESAIALGIRSAPAEAAPQMARAQRGAQRVLQGSPP